MLAIVAFCCSVFIPASLYAQLPQVALTDSAKVSLLTCSQGEELYSIFGHSAIRVQDPITGVDWVFNYGTFDFSDPNFYPNFVKGKLNYILSVSTYENFEYSYIFEQRYIYEQTLNLPKHEKQLLLDSLIVNYKPENRYYLYDFLFDNCATRIRDILVETNPNEVIFTYQAFTHGLSFRELLMPNVKEKPWAKLGINLLLGVSADRPAEPWEYMFLPEHMMTAFASASVKTDSVSIPLAQSAEVLLEGKEIPKARFNDIPLAVFIVVLIIAVIISFFDVRRKRPTRLFDGFLFGLVGLLGAVIAFQWFGSDHAVMAKNYNLIWTHPLHFVVAIFVFIKGLWPIARYYFGFNTLIMLLLLVLWFTLPQKLPLPMLPLVAAMGLRSAVLYKYLK